MFFKFRVYEEYKPRNRLTTHLDLVVKIFA